MWLSSSWATKPRPIEFLDEPVSSQSISTVTDILRLRDWISVFLFLKMDIYLDLLVDWWSFDGHGVLA